MWWWWWVFLVKANTEEMKQAIWIREGQRGSLSLCLSTASDRDGNEQRRCALPGLASLRREDERQTEEGDETGRETFINEEQADKREKGSEVIAK